MITGQMINSSSCRNYWTNFVHYSRAEKTILESYGRRLQMISTVYCASVLNNYIWQVKSHCIICTCCNVNHYISYTYTHTHMHTPTCTHPHAHTHMHTPTAHTHTHTCMHTHACTHMHAHTDMHTHADMHNADMHTHVRVK